MDSYLRCWRSLSLRLIFHFLIASQEWVYIAHNFSSFPKVQATKSVRRLPSEMDSWTLKDGEMGIFKFVPFYGFICLRNSICLKMRSGWWIDIPDGSTLLRDTRNSVRNGGNEKYSTIVHTSTTPKLESSHFDPRFLLPNLEISRYLHTSIK